MRASTTLSRKNQITIPASVVKALGLKAGDRLFVEVEDGFIKLRPQPKSWTDYFLGKFKGAYGDTKEEIDRYLAEERRSWERELPG